jgi:aspartate carbamoyltransferase regulatory subunit
MGKNNDNKKELQIAALENGTVIDHIPSEQLFKVVSLLGIERLETPVTIGYNLDSKKMGKKGILKIAGKFFAQDEINRISLIAPSVKLNIIRDYEVVEKKLVHLPDVISGIVRCNNPKCITNNEPMKTRFHVIDKDNVTLKCDYCELKIKKEDITVA